MLGRRRPAVGVREGSVDPVLGNRRGAASDGTGHLGRAGHAVQRRGPPTVPKRRARGHVPAGRDVRCYAKRTAIEEYTAQGRGGKGILTIQYDRRRGTLVGALIVDDETELYAITSGGGVIRTRARQVRKAGRQTKGVRLMNLGEGDTLIAIARNAEEDAEDDAADESDDA